MRSALRLVAAIAAVVAVAACAPPAAAAEVVVAVASNFAGPLARLADAFTAATGHRLKASSGSTGRFAAQVAAGAPFDVLLAADDETPRKLVAAGHAIAGTQFTYAIGRLALWSATPGLVDGRGAVLASGRYAHLAIANPKTAPYGAAALDVLKSLGLADAVAPRLVTAESIAQAHQFVASGNAELGFVAWAQIAAPGRPTPGSHWLVPPSLHREIRQDAVLLKAGEHNAAAAALLAFMKTAPAQALVVAHGYALR